MQKVLAGTNIWADLTPLLKPGRRRRAAIAYVTAAEVLPLVGGDQLLVDAEDATVAAGGTDPKVIGKWLRAGVVVRSFPGLHAKVVLTDRIAAIGSANASASSIRRLREAALVTDDAAVRTDLRAFFDDLWANADELDAAWVKRTGPLFGTARNRLPGNGRRRPGTVLPERVQRLQLIRSGETTEFSEDVEREVNKALRQVRRAIGLPARFVYETLEWSGPHDFAPGDVLCQVVSDRASGTREVWAPQQVIRVVQLPRRRKRWLILLTDTQLQTIDYSAVLATVGGDARRVPLERWIRNAATLRTVLGLWQLHLENGHEVGPGRA